MPIFTSFPKQGSQMHVPIRLRMVFWLVTLASVLHLHAFPLHAGAPAASIRPNQDPSLWLPWAGNPPPPLPTVSVAAGRNYTCAVINGVGMCWGLNDYGQLGNNNFGVDSNQPVDVAELSGVDAVSGGGGHSCALVNGAASCWGWNSFTQLGDGTMISRDDPAPVSTLNSGVSVISTGVYHTCAVANDTLKCWGSNLDGELGDGTNTSRDVPTNVVFD